MPTTEHEFTTATPDGQLVGWLREADDAKDNALLLHGGPGLSEYLSTLANELDSVVTTARYQQRGLAPSAVAGDASIEGHVADAVAVMDALGWQKPIVIGHSWGGHLALHLAAAHPDRVGALVILDALGATGDGGQAEFGPALRAGLSATDLARLEELEAIEEPTEDEQRQHLGTLWPQYFGDPASAPPMPPLQFATNGGDTWASIQAHFEARTLERALPGMSMPTLIVHGSRSPIPIEQAEQMAALMPNATFVVHDGKGHWAWLEEPCFIRAEMEGFLASG